MEDIPVPADDFGDEPTMIPFTPAAAREFLKRLGLHTESLGTPSASMNQIVSLLEKVARPRSPLPESSSPPPGSSSPPLALSSPTLPFLQSLSSLPPSSPPQSSPPSLSPLRLNVSLPASPTTTPPKPSPFSSLFSHSPLSLPPPTPPSRPMFTFRSTLTLPSPTALRSSTTSLPSLLPATTSSAMPSNIHNPPLNSPSSSSSSSSSSTPTQVPRRVRRRVRFREHDPYDSDTPSESNVSDGIAAINRVLHTWEFDPEVDPWLLTQVQSGVAHLGVARLRGGVWTPECRRNSAPLEKETSASASAASRAVDADSANEVLGSDEQPEEPEHNDHQPEEEVPPLRNNWMVNEGKKLNLDPKSSITSAIMYELYKKCVTVYENSSWVDNMVDALNRDGIHSSVRTSTRGKDVSLADAAEMVCRGNALEQSLGFMNMLSLINFRIRVERIQRTTRGTLADIYRDHLEKTHIETRLVYGTFCKWVNQGAVLADLASAGTVYLLFLLSAARLRGSLFTPLAMKDTPVICRALLRPDDGGSILGELVKTVFIPSISSLRRRLAISIPSALTKEGRNILGLADLDVIDFTDLEQVKAYCSCIAHNGWALPERDMEAWKTYPLSDSEYRPSTVLIDNHSVVRTYTAQTPRPEQSIDIPVTVVQVATQFDSTDKHNKFPCKRDMNSRMAWTLGERKLLPAACIRPTTVDAFIQEMIDSVERGYRTNPDSYLYYDKDQLGGTALDIRDKLGEPIVLVGCTVPSKLMAGLLVYIQALFPELCQTDSSIDGQAKFKCSHLNLYNRYSTKGNDAPHDADPWTLQKEGKRPADISQFTPRFSAEFYEQEIRGTRLLTAMKPLLEYMANVVKERFPKENGELVAFISGLPLNAASPVHPFGGVALNLNPATIVHLDPKDLNICLVLAIHDCTGGELVLEGPGIVIRLKSGDFAIFPSKRISHYNLDFKGLRVSFAFSTDNAAKQWIEDNNGWVHNKHMKSSRR
ncbi:hypothetical protein PQX77_007975 [Marasmius sp. AFHP31]|nr:hypothetical protein PQX77_007975 [Marasmius sp. AFHP31]